MKRSGNLLNILAMLFVTLALAIWGSHYLIAVSTGLRVTWMTLITAALLSEIASRLVERRQTN